MELLDTTYIISRLLNGEIGICSRCAVTSNVCRSTRVTFHEDARDVTDAAADDHRPAAAVWRGRPLPQHMFTS
jgi:uncharacterized membrane protein